mgnify:CR=1 FL=1
MKKLVIAACITCALALAVQAEQTTKKHHEMTADQKVVWKEMLTKYDTNKDGKLSKEERAKMSAEDKTKLEKAGHAHEHGKDSNTKKETQ